MPYGNPYRRTTLSSPGLASKYATSSTVTAGRCAMSLGLPFAAGWAAGGGHGALTALLWAGLVRVAVLQHVTWSVNSLCHVIGTRPFTTRRCDRATNLWPLALLSLGESWHNMHHSDPACARHGADPGQVDVSAAVIRAFERLGWATGVHWTQLRKHQPLPERCRPGAALRVPGADPQVARRRSSQDSRLAPGKRWAACRPRMRA